MPESEFEFVDPKDLRPGPIRNQELPAELLEQIGLIYDVIGDYLGTTLEQFEISFMRDADPASEVAIWCCVTGAWIKYHQQYLNDEIQPVEIEGKLIAALIGVSTGVEDPARLGVEPEVGRDLLAAWKSLSD